MSWRQCRYDMFIPQLYLISILHSSKLELSSVKKLHVTNQWQLLQTIKIIRHNTTNDLMACDMKHTTHETHDMTHYDTWHPTWHRPMRWHIKWHLKWHMIDTQGGLYVHDILHMIWQMVWHMMIMTIYGMTHGLTHDMTLVYMFTRFPDDVEWDIFIIVVGFGYNCLMWRQFYFLP